MTSFAGKTVLLTGASSGIGEATAKVLAARDARVLLASRRETELERVRSECDHPERHVVVPMDLAQVSRLRGLVEDLVSRVGPIDVLINNAGLSQWARAEDTPIEIDRKLMEVNYFAVLALTKAVLPAMVARGHGHIAAVSSVMGKIGTPQRSAYSASKHALHGFFDCLRAEVHDRGVRVSVICPGYVETEIQDQAVRADGPEVARRRGRGMEPKLFAERMVRALEREVDEAFIGGREIWGARVGVLLPGLLNWAVRRVPV